MLHSSRPKQSMSTCSPQSVFTELDSLEGKNVNFRFIIGSGSNVRVGSLHFLLIEIVFRQCCKLLVVFSS